MHCQFEGAINMQYFFIWGLKASNLKCFKTSTWQICGIILGYALEKNNLKFNCWESYGHECCGRWSWTILTSMYTLFSPQSSLNSVLNLGHESQFSTTNFIGGDGGRHYSTPKYLINYININITLVWKIYFDILRMCGEEPIREWTLIIVQHCVKIVKHYRRRVWYPPILVKFSNDNGA